MRKKKIFLGAYLNYTNAQNLNCLALAKYLDKDKFEVYALSTHFGTSNIDIDVNLFHCKRPFLISKYLGFIWGVLSCDIIYLPKHREVSVWVLRFAQFLGRKVFTTIEINMCDGSKENMINNFFGIENLKKYFSFIPNIFGISKFLITQSNCAVKLHPIPLYLGVESNIFKLSSISKLSNIVFIGSLIKRKNLDTILDIAKEFSTLNFHIIGDGELRRSLEMKATDNVIFYGKLTHNKIADILSNMDLHLLLSKSEGFPKVILETASAGVPSMVYNDYGAEEWINTNKNGFILSNKDEVVAKIKELIDNPELLISNAKEALKLAGQFSWTVQIKEWEKAITNLK